MADLKYNKATDSEHEIKLDSQLLYAAWRAGTAAPARIYRSRSVHAVQIERPPKGQQYNGRFSSILNVDD